MFNIFINIHFCIKLTLIAKLSIFANNFILDNILIIPFEEYFTKLLIYDI